MEDQNLEAKLPTCSCGHDRNHYMVSPKYKYTVSGWFWVTFVGVTTEPIKATYICRRCKETIEVITEPKILKNLI